MEKGLAPPGVYDNQDVLCRRWVLAAVLENLACPHGMPGRNSG